jgi:hypothetical protein
MKRRVIHPYKILAVALGAAGVGCTTTARPDPTPSTTAPATAAASPAPAAGPASPEGVAQHAPPADNKADSKLLALRDELDRTLPAEVVAKEAHFRPLCDKDGYPLVGNLNRKAPSPGTAPSAFCASVRSTKKPS